MTRLAAALLATLFMVGCAAQTEAPPPAVSTPAKAPGGLWRVTRAQAAAPMPTSGSPYLGRVVALGDTAAGTPSGRSCDHPTYAGRTAVATDILGTAVRPAEARDPTPRPVTAVTCGADDFGLYIHLADGGLLTRVNDWVLRLEPAPAPAPRPVTAPAPAPVTEAVAAPVAEAAPPPRPCRHPPPRLASGAESSTWPPTGPRRPRWRDGHGWPRRHRP